jgi:hypothetical protein
MSKNLSEADLSRLANFVFKGTVLRLKASTVREVPVNDRTVVVRVEETIESPESLVDFNGREVTVELCGRKRVKRGDRAIFYTNGWIFGDGLAVRSIDHRPATAAIAALGVTPGDPVENLANKNSRLRFETADVVVSGRVTSVKLPPAEVAAARAGLSMAADDNRSAPFKPISEHDPLIQEAVVEVDAVHKGQYGSAEAAVRFPSSTDVKWYKAPKFRPGQQGFFMLQRGDAKAAESATRSMVASLDAGAAVEGAFTALHPADFQSLERPGGVRLMISDIPGTAASEGD